MSALIRDQALAEDATPILDLETWLGQPGQQSEAGVRLPNTIDVEEIWPRIQTCRLIALEFPVVADGRAYSQARVLRDRLGYRGELRAVGGVIRDCLLEMHRCGFNAMVLRDDQDPQLCLKAFRDFSLHYQNAADGAVNIRHRRLPA